MDKLFTAFACLFFSLACFSQGIESRLAAAVLKLEADAKMKHAIIGLSVEDASGKSVFKKNAEVGLALASTQKVLTSIAAMDILGPAFRFNTSLYYLGPVKDSLLSAELVIDGMGDPSFGSSRWPSTKPAFIFANWIRALRLKGINSVTGSICLDPSRYSAQTIPDGWIWQDIGNYYGAGSGKINWRENQYDLHLRSGNTIGGPVEILNDFDSSGNHDIYFNELKSAPKGTGDKTNIYLPLPSTKPLVSGTIPIGEKDFSVSGAMPEPGQVFLYDLKSALLKNGINVQAASRTPDPRRPTSTSGSGRRAT